VYSKADLSVFEKLSAGQIGALTDVFYEAMVKSPGAEKVREVLGGGFDDQDVDRIVHSFRGFFVGAIVESDLYVLPSSSPADKDKIPIVRSAIDRMSSHNGTYDSEAQRRDLRAIFKLKPRKGPAPTIRGILSLRKRHGRDRVDKRDTGWLGVSNAYATTRTCGYRA